MRVSARRPAHGAAGVGCPARTGAVDPSCRCVGPVARAVDSAARTGTRTRSRSSHRP